MNRRYSRVTPPVRAADRAIECLEEAEIQPVRRRKSMKIKSLMILSFFAVAILATIFVAGCCARRGSEPDSPPGPAEKAGAALDNAMEKTGDEARRLADKAAEEAKTAADKALQKTGEVLEKAGSDLEKTGADMQDGKTGGEGE